MNKTQGRGDIFVIPRNAEYSREVRRSMKRQLPRGNRIVFEDEVEGLSCPVEIVGQAASTVGFIFCSSADEEHVKELEAAKGIILSSPQNIKHLNNQVSAVYAVLKKYGFIVGTLYDVALICLKRWPIRGARAISAHDDEVYSVNSPDVLTKAIWKEAIGIVLRMHEGDIDARYNRDYAGDLQHQIEAEGADSISDVYFQMLNTLVVVCGREKLKRETKATIKRAEAAEKKLTANSSSAKEANLEAQLTNTVAKYDARVAALQQEINTLVNAKRAAEEKHKQAIARLEEELAVYRCIEAQSNEVDELLDTTESLMDLPEDDVLFVGGHPNLVAKLRAEHCRWRFASKVSEIPEPVTCRYVFYYSKQISHKVQYKLQRYYSGPIMYCEGTNLERLNESMQRVYTACLSGNLAIRKVMI